MSVTISTDGLTKVHILSRVCTQTKSHQFYLDSTDQSALWSIHWKPQQFMSYLSNKCLQTVQVFQNSCSLKHTAEPELRSLDMVRPQNQTNWYTYSINTYCRTGNLYAILAHRQFACMIFSRNFEKQRKFACRKFEQIFTVLQYSVDGVRQDICTTMHLIVTVKNLLN